MFTYQKFGSEGGIKKKSDILMPLKSCFSLYNYKYLVEMLKNRVNFRHVHLNKAPATQKYCILTKERTNRGNIQNFLKVLFLVD